MHLRERETDGPLDPPGRWRLSAPSPGPAGPPQRAPHRFQQRLRFAPGSQATRGVGGPALILIGNALIGLLLAAASAAVLLVKMRPPLEEELVKRSAAVCRATAADLQYAVTVGDKIMAENLIQRLEEEPSARVAGAWLMERGELIGSWRRDGTVPTPPRLDASPAAGEILQASGRPYALVSCSVEAIQGGAAAPAAVLRPGGEADDVVRLWLLVDAEEISGTVRQGLAGALRLLSLAIFVAVGLQLAIALSVIARFNESMRQLRETRGRLEKADNLAALGTLAAGVAHEINNPLSYVVSNLEFLAGTLASSERGPGEAADVRDALAEARHGTERMRVIVRDLKALSSGDEETVAPIDVRRVAESSVNIAMNEIRHRARLVRDFGEVPPVEANEVRLGQVLLNLLVNAAHAIREGTIDDNEIRVSTRLEPDGRVAIEVRDTGSGISPENMAKLFEPFFTTKGIGEGTGLGLWLCQGIVSSLGGEIQVESELGRGTAFRVLLPASKACLPEDAARPPAAGARRGLGKPAYPPRR